MHKKRRFGFCHARARGVVTRSFLRGVCKCVFLVYVLGAFFRAYKTTEERDALRSEKVSSLSVSLSLSRGERGLRRANEPPHRSERSFPHRSFVGQKKEKKKKKNLF